MSKIPFNLIPFNWHEKLERILFFVSLHVQKKSRDSYIKKEKKSKRKDDLRMFKTSSIMKYTMFVINNAARSIRNAVIIILKIFARIYLHSETFKSYFISCKINLNLSMLSIDIYLHRNLKVNCHHISM